MKNLLKYLNIITIALLLAFNVSDVSAATCPNGTTKHTNYYLFLEGSSVETYVPDGNYRYTGADYYNNIRGATIVEQGNVNIGIASNGTVTNASKTWSVSQYWNYFKNAYSGANQNTLMYTSGNNNYLLHKNWWEYENPNFIGGTEKDANNQYVTSLIQHLNSLNSSNLASSPLVTTGTALPATSVVAPTGLATSSDTALRWNLTRNYTSVSGLNGVNVGYELNQVYSPAAYYVEFCENSGSGGNISSHAIWYNANAGTDTVTNMPSPKTQVFQTECTNISNSQPVREGYTFLGWNTDPSATTANSKYNSGEEYCGNTDLELYAIWQSNNKQFTVTYDANGGKDAPASQEGNKGSCIKLSDKKPTLEKNNFLGWSTDKNAKEADKNYAPGTEYCDGKDLTLYAVWQVQSGVSAHVIGFALIALTAGAALIMAKKKNLFRQI